MGAVFCATVIGCVTIHYFVAALSNALLETTKPCSIIRLARHEVVSSSIGDEMNKSVAESCYCFYIRKIRHVLQLLYIDVS